MLQKDLQVLGTTLRIHISQSQHAQAKVEAAFNEAKRIEAAFSRFLDNNELDELNSNIGKWTKVSNELFQLLSFGNFLEKESDGTFHLHVKSILESWGYNKKYELGTETSLEPLGTFELNPKNNEVFLNSPIEIGAIGKGYALDRMKAILKDEKNIFINAGGDIYAQGTNNGKPWTSYLQHPTDTTKIIAEVDIDGIFLAGSSPSERQWRNRHHLINARTQLPVTDMLAVFVKAETGLQADGYATMLFSMGYNKAKDFIMQKKLAALLINPDGDIFVSPWFQVRIYEKNTDR